MNPIEQIMQNNKDMAEAIIRQDRINKQIKELVDRNKDLEYALTQLKSQLLDTHSEDSLIIQVITNALKKKK